MTANQRDKLTVPKGTYLYGGLGMDETYARHIVNSLRSAGISKVYLGDIWSWRCSELFPSASIFVDVIFGIPTLRSDRASHNANLREFHSDGKQFNLIGYSFGALVVLKIAQEVIDATNFQIDNIVLIGSPNSQQQLDRLRREKRIKHIHILNLTELGDPIFSGIGFQRLARTPIKLIFQYFRKSGHFYYTKTGSDGNERRKKLAEELVKLGLK